MNNNIHTKKILKLKNIISNILITPIIRHGGLFLLLISMGALLNVVGFSAQNNFRYAIIHLSIGIISAWFICLLFQILISVKFCGKIIGLPYLFAVFFVYVLSFIFDIYSWGVTHNHFDLDYVPILLGTNLDESQEFLSTYLSTNLIVVFLACVLICILSYFVGRNCLSRLKINPIILIIIVTILLSSLLVSIFMGKTCTQRWDPITKMVRTFNLDLFIKIDNDLPPITLDRSNNRNSPQNIVIIIGESLSRSHCSIYGYGLDTQPYMHKLQADSLLVAYPNCISPGISTLESLKQVLTLWDNTMTTKWYKTPVLTQLAKTAGYKSIWISNQSKVGSTDNAITAIAELCDTTIWVSETAIKASDKINTARFGYDEDVINCSPNLKSPNDRFLFVYHLMGSHFKYDQRFPANYKIFSATDYLDKPVEQRNILAAYDNSVLYNDFVIDKIYNKFKDTNTLIIYFSDHGEDLFLSNPNYFGHGMKGNALSESVSKEVPLIFIFTPIFRQNNPELANRIRESQNSHVNLTNLVYTLMDIWGMDVNGYGNSKTKSFYYENTPHH